MSAISEAQQILDDLNSTVTVNENGELVYEQT